MIDNRVLINELTLPTDLLIKHALDSIVDASKSSQVTRHNIGNSLPLFY